MLGLQLQLKVSKLEITNVRGLLCQLELGQGLGIPYPMKPLLLQYVRHLNYFMSKKTYSRGKEAE